MIPIEKRQYFKRVGMSDKEIDALEDEMERMAKAASGLEFKEKGVAVNYVVEQAGDLAQRYMTQVSNASTIHSTVMKPYYKQEAVVAIADLLMTQVENADRDQVMEVVRSQLLGAENG